LYYFFLIFTKNIFKFLVFIFLQVIGIAMGCKCGPSIANLYLYILESKWMKLHRPLGYFRFIDDIFLISLGDINLEDFKKQFGYLKLNIVLSKSVNFLDLNISYDTFLCKLKFKLFIKPTYNGSYLVVNSNHPKHIFSNIPKSLFLRIRKICSSFIDFLYFSSKVINNLSSKGYNLMFLEKLRYKIGNTSRSDLLPYKIRSNNCLNSNSIKIFFEFDRNFDVVKELFEKTLQN